MAFTTVSAIVRDSDGQNWLRGTWKLEFIPSPDNPNIAQYVVDGRFPLSSTVLSQTGSMDGNGYFSLNLYDNTSITPIGSTWKLTICPLSSASCGFYTFSAAGSAIDISSALTFLLPAPRFLGVYPNYGYADNEVILSNKPGSTYYNVVQQAQKYFNDVTQTWAIVGTGPAGPTGPSGNPVTVVTDNFADLNTFINSGVYLLVQGAGNGAPAPGGTWNTTMSVLEVFSYSGLVGGNPVQHPYILQRFWASQDNFAGAQPGRWFMRWGWWNGTTNGWSSWFYYLMAGTA